MITRTICLAAGMAVTTLISGCSFFAPWNQQFTVHAEPESARIFINGVEVGEGHVTQKVRRNKTVSVLVTHPDYVSQTQEVRPTMSALGSADVIGGALILLPAIGVLAPGAWNLQQGTVAVSLEPRTAPAAAE